MVSALTLFLLITHGRHSYHTEPNTPATNVQIAESDTECKDDEYCFTSFPQPATEELARDGHAECLCTGWFKRKVLSTPGFPSPIVRPPRKSYEVREVRGRGLGLFATEDIEAGDLILAERPLIVKPHWPIHISSQDVRTQAQSLRVVRGCLCL